MKLGNPPPGTQRREEGRGAKEPSERKTKDMSKSSSVSTKRRRIAELARQARDMAMNLSHHMDLEWFEEAYRRTRKDGAVGVDGEGAREYAADLRCRLEALMERAKSGSYRAPPVRRVHIPKGKGKETRPIGIPTFEDKVLQRAVVTALEAVYEQDFLDCSYGFRPGRSQHQALQALRRGLMKMCGGYVIDLDIRRYFDSVDHRRIQSVVRRRVRDGVVRRLIGKWLNAGVMERGQVSYPERGVPQGGVISPMLSNIYLHEALDTWFEHQVKPRMRGQALLVRFADDAVLAFEREDDAARVMKVLPKRLAAYGLEMHAEKTRRVRFVRPPLRRTERSRAEKRETFDFLGFTHYWRRTRRGGWAITHKTARDRFSRAVKGIGEWLSRVRHWPIAKQHEALGRKMVGHMNYYGITGNVKALGRFVDEVERRWRMWLSRRSQKAKGRWDWFRGILKRFPLPRPRVFVRLDDRIGRPREIELRPAHL